MLDLILAALGRQPGVHDWAVRQRRSRSTQLYVIGQAIESFREVTTEEYQVEVYNDHPFPASGGQGPEGAARGVGSITLVPADAGHIAERIADAVTMAQLVSSPPYALAGPAEYPDVPLADPTLTNAGSAQRMAHAFADQLWDLVDREPQVRLSAGEVFLTNTDTVLRTSRGIDAGMSSTRVLAEIALLARGQGQQGDEEAEHFRQIEARQIEDLRLEAQVQEAARFARDTLSASAPRTRVGPVVLSGEALVTLFEAFTFRASAQAAYMKLTDVEPGQSVLGERPVQGDALTLRSNALRPYGMGSYCFDGDGVPGQAVRLIEQGRLKQRLATQRYGQYLGVPVTGSLGTVEVAPGSTPLADLLATDVLQVVGFSAPEVDSVTGDFGSEIRLGYRMAPDGPHPVKGGSVSGNVFDAFANARFSLEIESRKSHVIPVAIRFESLSVSGE